MPLLQLEYHSKSHDIKEVADLGKLQITGIRLQSCLGCGAGFVESCLCVSSVLVYLVAWTKGPWIHLSLANNVKYSRVCSINLESAKKMKAVFNETRENLDEGLQLPENLEYLLRSVFFAGVKLEDITSHIKLFADDALLYGLVHNSDDAMSLQPDLDKLVE
ncbi:hypothetical protein pdam_00021949 [Pocillopora damicornis]|uniref:Uncharacterized protein n=1 Tax=Pocillopora damicornis TaxID=46731 RepID=A0A3M6UWB7_POCDA|nr:hypothetical protein pdam_00021949 [Pocillopora damicornis]